MTTTTGVQAGDSADETSRPPSDRVFSGVQPSGLPHLGNYLGAFRNYIALQERGDAIYCIVDYHALTSTHDAERDPPQHPRDGARRCWRSAWTRSSRSCSASRTDPSTPSWPSCCRRSCPVSWVERTPSLQGEEARPAATTSTTRCSTYPVLQTADIAIYNARYVPVGKDQAAHLELAREIVRAWNRRYGEYLRRAAGGLHRFAHRSWARTARSKMSKSLGNVIEIFGRRGRPSGSRS